MIIDIVYNTKLLNVSVAISLSLLYGLQLAGCRFRKSSILSASQSLIRYYFPSGSPPYRNAIHFQLAYFAERLAAISLQLAHMISLLSILISEYDTYKNIPNAFLKYVTTYYYSAHYHHFTNLGSCCRYFLMLNVTVK